MCLLLACCPTHTHKHIQVGIIGAGRIGAAYARMMVEGHKMNLVYYDPYPNTKLEDYIKK
jgi:hydroxypyruvate reductase 1